MRPAYPLLVALALALAAGCGADANANHADQIDPIEEHSVPADYSAPQIFERGQTGLDRLAADQTEARCIFDGAVAEVGIERYETHYGLNPVMNQSDGTSADLAALDIVYDLVDARTVADVVAECVDLDAALREVLIDKRVPGAVHECVVTNRHRVFFGMMADELHGDEDSVLEAAAQLNWTVSSCIELDVGT